MSSIKPMLETLEDLFQKFNEKFYDGELETPVITISPDTTRGAYGWATTWKAWTEDNKDSGYYEINICAEYLDRTELETSATLLHEMVHIWNLQNGVKDCSRGGTYHNKKFKVTAEERGLIIEKSEKHGWTLTTLNEDAFDFIKALGKIDFKLHRTKAKKSASKKKSSSKKYVCPECGLSVRATKEVYVMCGECQVKMESGE